MKLFIDSADSCKIADCALTSKVNVTLCFQPVQAMMAAKAGATRISGLAAALEDAKLAAQ